MNPFHEERTIRTPLISGNAQSGIIEISGRSYPENAVEFYQPFKEWLMALSATPPPSISFTMDMEYFNTSTEGTLFEMISLMNSIKDKSNVQVIWKYEIDDNDMENKGIILHRHFGDLIKLVEKAE